MAEQQANSAGSPGSASIGAETISGYLARLVTEHRLDEDEALETAVDLVTTIPRKVFKL